METLKKYFNYRVGIELDYVGHAKSDVELGLDNFDNQIIRNLEEKTWNDRGKDLLDICKLYNFLILNGCMTGDVFGNLES